MADFRKVNLNKANNMGEKIIEEKNYQANIPMPSGPAAVGKGGDPLFKNINATKEQLKELLEETSVVQDWTQREKSNNVALACLDNDNLKEIYFEMKNGFGEYGPIVLMGYKTPQGIEIPRLKLYDSSGNVVEVLTGPLAIEELNKRAVAFREMYASDKNIIAEQSENVIQDYSGNPDDYTV